jgi:membrane protease YdiL (CAAX protease family)
MTRQRIKKGLFQRHSLSIIAGAILLLWVVLYLPANPSTHWGSFFGNAIADWTGVMVTVLATKYFYEKGSRESRQPHFVKRSATETFFVNHSLTLFLLATGVVWVLVYMRVSPGSKWGQVVSNIVSEWTQLLGLVILTKKFFETRSKE